MDMLSGGSGEAPDFDSFANPEQGLQEHLMDQARSALSGMDLMIAAQLIGQIDEAGYLEVNLLETAHGMGVPLYRIEQVLGVIHGFDPTGVGARSLSACLALQAKDDRKGVVEGKGVAVRVALGGRRCIKKKK